MKTLINERDLDRLEVEAEALVKKMETDFLKAFQGSRSKRDIRGRKKGGKEVANGEQSRLLEY